jgi:hypothetical protein
MIGLFSGALGPGALRAIGFVLVAVSVIGPSLPAGWLFQQPPMPVAALWAAYGWAAEDEGGVRAPIVLALFGLLHDVLAGGPVGLFMALYCSAYLIGRTAAVMMSAPNLISLWGGFIVTALACTGLAALLLRWSLGAHVSVRPFAEAVAITALLFPLARPLYMSATPSLRTQMGSRS